MRKSKKILSLLASATATVTLIAPTVTACSSNNQYDTSVSVLKEETIKQFKSLVPIPRYSDRYDYSNIGVKTQQENLLNNIKKHYKEIVEGEKIEWVDQGEKILDGAGNFICEGNCYFDIPASDDGKDIPMIILQGHMDIVFARAEGSTRGLDTPIEIEEATKDGHPIIQSKNSQSSIGADDGIGIATMLSILINRDKFTHGKIRCLFTTEEEPGLIGAEQVPSDDDTTNGNWFREEPKNKNSALIKYFLNIDGEDVNSSDIANSGGTNYTLSCKFKNENKLTNTSDYTYYEFEANNFYGGHSSLADVHTSPLRYLTSIVGDICNENKDKFVISNVATSGTDVPNAIPTGASVIFGIIDSTDKTNEYDKILKEKLDEIKQNFPEEDKVTCSVDKVGTKPTDVLNVPSSKKILSLLNELSCGVVSPKTDINYYATSNIAPVKMDLNPEEGNPTFSLGIYARSFNVNLLNLMKTNIEAKYYEYLDKNEEDQNLKFVNPNEEQLAFFEPWVPDENNPMRLMLVDAFKSANINNPTMEYCPGCLECSWWFQKQPTINIGVIGPTIDDPHSIKETIYLDTLDPMLQVLVYTLKNLKPVQ